ncbi:hypothetical protein N9966_00450 [bacterium]|nr:hypothetical protein [bacterium]
MSNKHCGPDIVKYFVVEPTGGGGTTTGATGNFFVCSGTTFLSTISGCTNGVDFNGNTFYNSGDVFFNGVITACTGIHTSNIYGCSPITVHDELILLNKLTLSAVTQDDTLTQILGRDNSTGEVKYRDISSIAPAAKLQNTYFVSSLSGDNSTALVGDINNPWKTITEARNQAVADGYSNSLIHVYSGEYLEDEIQYENGNFYFEPNSKVTTQRTASGGTTSIFRLGQTLVYESNTYSANTCNVYGYGDFSVSATTDTDSFGGFILSMLGDSNSYFEFNDAYVHSGEAFYAGGNSILTLEGHDILLDPSGSDGLDFSDTSTTLINVNDIVGGNSHWNIHYRTSFAGKSVVNFNKLIGSDQLIAFDRFMQPTAEITMNFNLIEHTGGSQYIINSGDNLGAKVTLNGDFYAPYGNGILLYHDAGEYNINGNITCRDTALLSIDTLSPSNNFVLNYNGDIVTSGVTSDFSSNGGVELNKITVNLNGSLTNLSLGALSNGINIDSNSILNIGNFDINVVSGNTIGTSSSNVVNINHSLSINKPFSSGITATGLFNYTGTTNVGDLVIYNTPTNDNSLTQILGRNSTTGDVEYRDVSSIISGATSQDTFVTGSTLSGSTLLLSRNDGVELTTDLSSILFTGNTSGDCITDLYITNLYGCSPITVNDTLSLTNNARLNINATSSFTLAVESYDNNIATFRDIDGEDIFFAQGSLANQDLVFGFGDFGDAYGYAGYTLDTVLNQHNFTNGNLYLGNVSTFNTDTKLYVDGNAKVTDSLSATTFYGDGSNLTGISTDNFFVSGGTYNSGTDDINFVGNSTETTFDVDLSSLVSSVSGDTFVVSGNANAATSQLTFTNNSGGTFTVANSAALFSDNDINVTGGTYNPSNGCITFGTNSGTTFDVCGFVTGFTDSYTTDAYLSGTEVRFDNSVEGVNYYNVDLNPLLSGKTDNTTFNTYTANTQTILDGKIDSANNVGGANEFFKDKSGTTLNFRTLSGGSNTTVSTVGDVVKVDVTVPSTTNTFVTGGTLNSGTLILERQDGTVTITGFTTDLDTYVTGGTVSVTATNDNNDGTIGLFYKNSEGVPHTLPFKDTFITGGTYDNGSSTIEFTKNDSTTFDVDLSSIDVNNTFSTGGTVTQSATSGSTDVTIQITGNDGFTPYNITGLTDTFVNDFSYSAQTFTITQNDGSTFETEVESIDLANILSGVTFDIATSGSISATTFNGGTFNGTFVGDGSGLTGITDNNTFVTGTTFNSNEATLTRNDGFVLVCVSSISATSYIDTIVSVTVGSGEYYFTCFWVTSKFCTPYCS